MERENKKRGREGEDKKEFSEKSAKKQDLDKMININFEDSNNSNYKTSSDNYLPLGVFDFPWLKEGMISKSEDWKLEDTFSSSLNDSSPTIGVEYSGQCLCQTTAALVDFPEDKFKDNAWAFEGDGLEGVDCIWSSLLNQPLEPGV